MRVLRNKHNRKTLSFYKINFNFREPFLVLLDGNFIHKALSLHLPNPIEDLIPKMLQGKANFVITHCIRKELETLGVEVEEAFEYSKNIKRIKCHHDPPISAYECLLDLANKQTKTSSEKYFFATQDPKLKSNIRQIPGIPLISFNRSVLVLDAPSHQNMKELTSVETVKRGISEKEKEVLYNEYHILPDTDSKPIKRKHKPQGPNPLSCLKKKRTNEKEKEKSEKTNKESGDEEDEVKHKKTRRGRKKPKKIDEKIDEKIVADEEEGEKVEEKSDEEDDE